MNCEGFKEQMLDRIGIGLDSALGNHLARCASCRAEFELIRALEREIRTIPDPDVDPTLWERLPDRVLAEIRNVPKPRPVLRVRMLNFVRPAVFPKENVSRALAFACSVLLVVGMVFLTGDFRRTAVAPHTGMVPGGGISFLDPTAVIGWLETSGADSGPWDFFDSLTPQEKEEFFGELVSRTVLEPGSNGTNGHPLFAESGSVLETKLDRYTEGELQWIYESL